VASSRRARRGRGPDRWELALMAIGIGALHLVTAFSTLDLLSRNPC
jgi:hypothetical protein